MLAAFLELGFECNGDGGFARAGEAGKPEGGAALVEALFAVGSGDVPEVGGDIGGFGLSQRGSRAGSQGRSGLGRWKGRA